MIRGRSPHGDAGRGRHRSSALPRRWGSPRGPSPLVPPGGSGAARRGRGAGRSPPDGAGRLGAARRGGRAGDGALLQELLRFPRRAVPCRLPLPSLPPSLPGAERVSLLRSYFFLLFSLSSLPLSVPAARRGWGDRGFPLLRAAARIPAPAGGSAPALSAEPRTPEPPNSRTPEPPNLCIPPLRTPSAASGGAEPAVHFFPPTF